MRYILKDDPQFGRTIVENVERIKVIVESDHLANTALIAQELNIAQMTV